MEIKLILFDSISESAKGTLRGFILVVLFFIVDLLLNFKKYKTFNHKHYILKFLLYLFIASALAINQAKSFKEAIIWGFGIGSTVFGTIIFSNMLSNLNKNQNLQIIKNIIYYAIGVTQCIIFSSLMYLCFFYKKK
tara:strand:+ start:118 stop:525 length:408 start_codon:yes stop_codon:yes gene_type:complete